MKQHFKVVKRFLKCTSVLKDYKGLSRTRVLSEDSDVAALEDLVDYRVINRITQLKRLEVQL